MFGVELTLGQKVSIALVLVAMGISVVFITKAFKPEPDLHINAYTTTRQRPLADDEKRSGRITTTNPRDPKKDEKTLNIAVVDGMLEVTRFPNDPGRHVRIKWTPERRIPGLVYQYYRDPMKGVEAYSDGFRHALAFATFKKMYEVPQGLGLLGSAGLTSEQAQQELTARTLMQNEVDLLRGQRDEGRFRPEMVSEVEKALAAYDAYGGRPEEDAKAADLARKVLEGAVKYMAAEQEEEDKSIERYVMTMDSALTSEQKSKVVGAYEAYVRNNPKGRSGLPLAQPGRSVPAANRGAATVSRGGPATNRGNVTTAPGRGPATTTVRGPATTMWKLATMTQGATTTRGAAATTQGAATNRGATTGAGAATLPEAPATGTRGGG